MNVLISACLLGVKCRYDGKEKGFAKLKKLPEGINFIPVCPEQLGGLPTPRPPAERRGEKVINSAGKDVTENFLRGAEEALGIAKLFRCEYAVLKEKSPSCGTGLIYDGSFGKNLIVGMGLTAELLSQNGIDVMGESQFEDFLFEDFLFEDFLFEDFLKEQKSHE